MIVPPKVTNFAGLSANDGWVITWTLGKNDIGKSADEVAASAHKSAQIGGVFGTESAVVIEASNDRKVYHTVTDQLNTPVDVAAPGIYGIPITALELRPRVIGGDDTTKIIVSLFVRKGT